MICKHCGNPLSIEDDKCPFCGEINQEVIRHTRAMRHYSKEFTKAKNEAEASNRLIRSFTVFLIIAVVLALGNAVVLFLRFHAQDIADNLERKRVNRNVSAYEEKIVNALSEDDLYSFKCYYDDNYLYRFDDLKRYDFFSMIGGYYCDLYTCIMDLYDSKIVGLYRTDDELLQKAASCIQALYEEYDHMNDTYSTSHQWMTDIDFTKADEIKERMELMISVYCNIDLKEVEAMKDSTPLQISMQIGRGMGLYE